MSAEIAVYEPRHDLQSQMDYARAVSEGSLLPDAYRGKPANVMIAVGLGASMGLSPAESLYRIAVINGKPAAGAELIAANVRKAGHRLRVRGDEESCTATIIRRDDPDYEFTVTRDLAWAQRMGLATNPNYKRQPGTMLQWRAITACARLACPEALYGVAYTPDELTDDAPRTLQAEPTTGAARMAQMLGQQAPANEDGASAPTAETGAGVVEDSAPREATPTTPESPLLNTRGPLAKRMFASLNEVGIGDDDRIDFCSATIGRTITSSKEMTDEDAHRVIAAANALRVDDISLNDPALDES